MHHNMLLKVMGLLPNGEEGICECGLRHGSRIDLCLSQRRVSMGKFTHCWMILQSVQNWALYTPPPIPCGILIFQGFHEVIPQIPWGFHAPWSKTWTNKESMWTPHGFQVKYEDSLWIPGEWRSVESLDSMDSMEPHKEIAEQEMWHHVWHNLPEFVVHVSAVCIHIFAPFCQLPHCIM